MVPSALLWLRNSSRAPFRLIGVNSTAAPLAEHLVDAFHLVPRGDASDYADHLLEIVRRHKVDVVFPWSDEESLVLSSQQERFAKEGCKILTSPPEVLAKILDKQKTYELLSQAGLKVPEYSVINTPADLIKMLESYGYPKRSIIVKPTAGRGGRGVFLLEGKDAPPEWLGSGQREGRIGTGTDLASISDLVTGKTFVMPCLKAPVFDADVWSVKGRAEVVVVRERHNPTGIPFEGNTLVRNKAVEDYCRKAAEVLELDALHDMDLMTSEDGTPVLLEVNPRASGSLAATLAAGVPILDAALASAVGKAFSVPLPKGDVEILAYKEAVGIPV